MARKGDISILLVFSLVITVIGIALVFAFIGRNSGGAKEIYCKTLYSKDGTDRFCEDILQLEVTSLKKRAVSVSKFWDNRKTEFLRFNPTRLEGTTSVKIPRNAKIHSANISMGLAENKLTFFGSGEREEIMVYPPGRLMRQKKLPSIPPDTMVTRARVEVTGAEYPTKAQVVFIIDTSGSMVNEWQGLCSILDSAKQSVLDLGLDLTTDVWGLGEGDTAGSCIKGRVTEGQLNSVTALRQPQLLDGGHARVPPYDLPSEAWGPGSGWLCDNYHGWNYDSDNKRIVIPISDSDPTGGGGTLNTYPAWSGPGEFSGTEWPSINTAIGMCKDPLEEYVYVLPITGDDSAPPEGYGIGEVPCNSRCQDVMAMMNTLATQTYAISSGAQIVGFDEPETIKEQIIKIMTTPFPSDIELSIQGTPIWFFYGQLNDSNSPQTVDGPEFADNLNQKCIGVPEGCDINVTSEEGTVVLNKLAIRYLEDPLVTGMTVGSYPAAPDAGFPNYGMPNVTIDIKEQIEMALADCPADQKYCEIPISVLASKNGSIELYGLEIVYDYYDMEKDILDSVIQCWKESNQGKSERNLLCDEIVVGPVFEYSYPISEEGVTLELKERNFCHIFENSDFACGDDDMLSFDQDLMGTQNILIEYNSQDKRIIVS